MHQTVIRFDDNTWETLRKLSFDTRESINSIVNKAVDKYLCEVRDDEATN